MQDNDDSGSDKQSISSALGHKRPREEDDFADADGGERPSMQLQGQSQEGKGEPPAKSGIIIHGERSFPVGGWIRIHYRCAVNGVPMDFTDVTDDHHEKMTPEEYEAYFEVVSSIG